MSRGPVPLNGDQIYSGSQTSASSTSLAPHNIAKSLYKTMATSLDDTLVGPSMLDLMYTSLSRQLNDVVEGIGAAELAGLGSSFLSQALKGNTWIPPPTSPRTEMPITSQPIGGESGTGSFTAPICDLFIELFDLKENNWLRRQAIVVILQQFLGGTIERWVSIFSQVLIMISKVRDSLRSAMSADSLERSLASFQEILWPERIRRQPSEARKVTDKSETRLRASKKLALLIPGEIVRGS